VDVSVSVEGDEKVDCWNSVTFDDELKSILDANAEVIFSYWDEDKRLMERHLTSEPYESLLSNPYSQRYNQVLENQLLKALARRKIRVWHYARMTDNEVELIKQRVMLSTLPGLRARLDKLVSDGLLTDVQANEIFQTSPFQNQSDIRAGKFYAVTIPVPARTAGTEDLLKFWGGESAYFRFCDGPILKSLAKIGNPRIFEVEINLRDSVNAYAVAETVLRAEAVRLGVNLIIDGSDIAVRNQCNDIRVIRAHTCGDELFECVGNSYPDGCAVLPRR